MWSPWVFDQIHNLFPQARITSGYRGPNNPLSRRNPNSAHTHGSPDDPGAVDVAPIPGIGFDQYVSKLKAAGVPVTKALDEQAHPVAWSTGPNWHVSLATGGNKQMPVSPVLDPKKRAAMFNVNIPLADAAPQPFNIQQALQGIGSSLPDGSPIAAAMADNKATGEKKSHGLFGKDSALWKILGVLGDGYTGNPVYSKSLLEQRQMDQDQQQFQARLDAERQVAQAKANEPPQFIRNLQAFQAMPKDQQSAYLQYLDMTSPITVADPQRGTLRVPRSMGGAPPEAVSELRSAVAKGDTGAIAEFEQVFGPGSASSYLGQ